MANQRLSYYTSAVFGHNKHLGANGQRVPLQPNTFDPDRPLTHPEMDYNLAYIEETFNGYKIWGSGPDGTVVAADENKALIFHEVVSGDTNIIAGGYNIGEFVWVPAEITATTSGTSGTSGYTGTSGTSGTDGTNGSNGTSGTSGISGTDGTDGSSGTSGTSGTDGSSGTSGTDGTDGSSGTSGTSGT